MRAARHAAGSQQPAGETPIVLAAGSAVGVQIKCESRRGDSTRQSKSSAAASAQERIGAHLLRAPQVASSAEISQSESRRSRLVSSLVAIKKVRRDARLVLPQLIDRLERRRRQLQTLAAARAALIRRAAVRLVAPPAPLD